MHVMIDLETLGTGSDCAVLSIGAVNFDPVNGLIGTPKLWTLEIDGQLAKGRKVEHGTVMWLLRQSEEARKAIYSAPHVVEAAQALDELAGYGARYKFPWSHGAGFDLAILDHMYRQHAIPAPWKFWDHRDTRTIFALTGVRVDRAEGTHHNAADDAVAQAKAVCAAYKALGKAA